MKIRKPRVKSEWIWVGAVVIVAIGIGVAIGFVVHKPVPTIKVSKLVSTTKPKLTAKAQPKSPIAYHTGDTQTDGQLAITLDSAEAGTTMGELPTGYGIFQVNLTATNNGVAPVNEQVGYGFTALSSVYTQVGSDVSTGRYIQPDNSGDAAGCFGGGTTLIAPQQTITNCVVFLVPTNVLVDTYFYDNLKWYLP